MSDSPLTEAEKLMQDVGVDSWDALHQWSVDNKEDFWARYASKVGLVSREPFSALLARDGRLNIAETIFQGDLSRPAIHHNDGTISRQELDELTGQVAAALRAMGIQSGTGVGICMSLGWESIVLYLGIVRMGAYVVSIAESFSTDEIELRASIGHVTLMITEGQVKRGPKHFEHYAKVRAGLPQSVPCIVLRPSPDTPMQEGDISYAEFMQSGEGGDASFHIGSARDCINVLFSSGTTGDPKAIPWDHTTPLKGAMDGCYHMDVRPGDRVMFATSLGWMMGPWLVFASLLNGASMAVLADVPTMANVGHLIETHRVTQLGIVPSMVRGWRKLPYEPRDWSSIRCYFSTGEASQFEDYAWLSNNGQVPVIEYCGGTEIGGGYISGSLVQEQRLCKFSTPCLGVRVWLRDDFDDWVPHGEEGEGEVFLEGPSLGLSETLLNYDHDKVYFSNIPEVEDDPSIHLRRHGDRLVRDADGYWQACGRCDDTMNLGGIKISSLEIERVCNPHPAVLESAAVSMAEGGRSGGPEDLYLFLVVKSEEEAPHTEQEWAQLMGRQVKEHLNPLFKVKGTKIVNMLPRTSTNKIMRRKLRDQLRSELQSVEEEKA